MVLVYIKFGDQSQVYQIKITAKCSYRVYGMYAYGFQAASYDCMNNIFIRLHCDDAIYSAYVTWFVKPNMIMHFC